jgi:hypothetical protein
LKRTADLLPFYSTAILIKNPTMKHQLTPHRRTRSIASSLATLALLGALGTAQAAIFNDAQLESL